MKKRKKKVKKQVKKKKSFGFAELSQAQQQAKKEAETRHSRAVADHYEN